MRGFICLTDFDWYDHLFESQPQDEVNFWRLGRPLSDGFVIYKLPR